MSVMPAPSLSHRKLSETTSAGHNASLFLNPDELAAALADYTQSDVSNLVTAVQIVCDLIQRKRLSSGHIIDDKKFKFLLDIQRSRPLFTPEEMRCIRIARRVRRYTTSFMLRAHIRAQGEGHSR